MRWWLNRGLYGFYLDEGDPTGGNDDDIDLEDGEDDDEDEDDDSEGGGSVFDQIDADFAKAQQDYQKQMEAIGAQFDSNGNFIGWKTSGLDPNAGLIDPDADPSDPTVQMQRQYLQQRPAQVASMVSLIASENPKLSRYKAMVEGALNADPTYNIDRQSVTSLFYFFRGQAADVEIAEVKKTTGKGRKPAVTKIDKGAAALSEGGTTVSKKTKGKDAPVTDQIKKLAKQWNINAQKLANDFAKKKQEGK